MYLSANQVIEIVSVAILERQVLSVKYKHTTDELIVVHQIAPFDIGTTNPKNAKNFADNLYAYSFTRKDRKTNRPDPRVAVFNINSFMSMEPTGDTFDETDLAIRNLEATKYDYRNCRFALVPNRGWFRQAANK